MSLEKVSVINREALSLMVNYGFVVAIAVGIVVIVVDGNNSDDEVSFPLCSYSLCG